MGDVAEAVLRCVENADTRGKIYELGGPSVYSFRQLMLIMLHETGRKRLLVPVPFFAAYVKAFFLQLSSLVGIEPLLTMDQVTLLKSDNVVSDGALTLSEFGIVPDSLEAIIPSYLWRFRAKGQYQEIANERVAGTPY